MLSMIIGKKFNRISRAADMFCLFLGEDYVFTSSIGTRVNVAEYALHFQTQWRFREGKEIFLAARDIYEPLNPDTPEDWQCDAGGSVFDVRVALLAEKMRESTVEDVQFSDANDLIIRFSNGVVLEQFTPTSVKDEEWRLIDYENNLHIVCYDENGNIVQA